MRNAINVIVFLLIIFSAQVLLQDYIHFSAIRYASIVLTLFVAIVSVTIFLENRNPAHTVAWLSVLASVPFLGFVFYLMFGRNYRKERMFRKKYYADLKIQPGKEDSEEVEQAFYATLGLRKQRVVRFAKEIGESPLCFATETEVLTDGEVTFAEIRQALEEAKHHIHLEYYIVRHDRLGNEIKEILLRKAAEGVKVRFLYDDVGCYKLSPNYVRELVNGGVEMVSFNPVYFPLFNNKFNFRNHRKIVVVDGKIGFVGGLNIGDEYLGKSKEFGFWRDTHLKMVGDAVRMLQMIFLQDWCYMTKKEFSIEGYFPKMEIKQPEKGGVQILASGPDHRLSVIKEIYFSMIISARESIWIASPYFIPDEDILSAIKTAAMSGIDVRLLVPSKPDHRIVFHASRSYFPDLLEAGVKIYEYEKGFMHSKLLLVDGEFASVGTANMDMRSFHLNFEVNAFLYRTDSLRKLEEDYAADLEDSHLLSLERFENRNFVLKFSESLARLVSPLL